MGTEPTHPVGRPGRSLLAHCSLLSLRRQGFRGHRDGKVLAGGFEARRALEARARRLPGPRIVETPQEAPERASTLSGIVETQEGLSTWSPRSLEHYVGDCPKISPTRSPHLQMAHTSCRKRGKVCLFGAALSTIATQRQQRRKVSAGAAAFSFLVFACHGGDCSH